MATFTCSRRSYRKGLKDLQGFLRKYQRELEQAGIVHEADNERFRDLIEAFAASDVTSMTWGANVDARFYLDGRIRINPPGRACPARVQTKLILCP